MYSYFNEPALDDQISAQKIFEFTDDPELDVKSLKMEFEHIMNSGKYMYDSSSKIAKYIGE